MDSEPLDKIEELRHGLRNKRNNFGDTVSSDRAYGAGLQPSTGNGGSFNPISWGSDAATGSTDESAGRGRRTVRRSGKRSSSVADRITSTTSNNRGRKRIKKGDEEPVIREYPEQQQVQIPARPRIRRVDLSPIEKPIDAAVDQVKDAIKSFGGKKLSATEAEELHDPLIAAIPDWAGYLDELVWKQTGDASHKPIWSDLDDDEVKAIATLLLKQGQKHASVAQVSRTMVDASDFINVGIIMVPRTIETINKLTEKQRQERMARLEARRRQQDNRNNS